nr:hypothetical protein [Tanacetum cinerariifolium]
MLLEKHDPPVVHDSEETLQLAQESREKMKRMNKEIKPANYTKINHLSGVFVPQTALSREGLYFSNNSKTANVSKSFSIPNEDHSDDTTSSVAQAAKFVRDFKSLTNEADASLAKHKALELEIERLLKAVVSQDIMIIVQNKSVVDTSDLQTELELTSNSVSTPQESQGVNNDQVIPPGMFRINPDKTYWEEKHVPNTVNASSRTKPITVSQPHVITKKDVNYDLNGFSSIGIDNTKTRRPQPRSNTKNDWVPSASKSSQSENKDVKDVISKVVCAKCNKCLNSVNHDVCLNSVNGKKSRGRKHKANVSKNETQKNYRPKVSKSKNVGPRESLATPKPRKPRFFLRWSPTGILFDHDGKLVAPSNSESHVDCSNGDNACTSN